MHTDTTAACCRQELKRITADFQQCSRVVIAVGQQLVGRQAEMEALGVDEVLSDLGELQVAEKEKLRCELTLQARLTLNFWQDSID